MEELFREIERCVSLKDFSKAKELAQKIEPESMRHNMLGVLFYQENELDKALEHFQKALKLDPTNDDVLFNLSKVLFEKKNFFESWRYLTRIKDKTWEVYDLLGDTQLAQNNVPMALHYYSKAAQLSDLPQMKEKFEQAKIKFKRPEKIAIFCLPGLDNFIKDIAQVLSNVFEVKLIVTTDGNQIVQAYKWADIVWLEWANKLAVEITNKLEKMGKRILCRLHGYESLRPDFLRSIKWEKIDEVIFVAQNVLETAIQNCDHLKRKERTLIHNGLDLNKYTFKQRSKGPNLAFAGHFNYKKNPVLAVQILKKLVSLDERYNLQWAGTIQDERMYRYIGYILERMGIREKFHFVGWKDDINSFLENKNFFLSTSIHEGYGVAIMEAMAKGIKPVIHNFYVAEEFYPKDWIFNTVDEAVEMITSNDYDSERYRRFIEDVCSLEKQISEIFRVLLQRVSVSSNTVSEINCEIRKSYRIFNPLEYGIKVNISNYEDELEMKLNQAKAFINQVPTDLLINNVVPLIIDFLEEFIGKGIPYQKTVYYAFLKDLHEKGYYKQPPEPIISKFLEVFESIKRTGKILKPIVAFHNDGNLMVFDPLKRQQVRIPDSVSLLVASGHHRVAIAKFLGMRTVPTYVVSNQFVGDEGALGILITYWQPYLQEALPVYVKYIQEAYVGAFDGSYQSTIDQAKKEIVEKFVLRVKPKTLIDIGCNRGELSYRFLMYGVDVLGVDISPREKLNLPPDYKFIQLDVVKQDLPQIADVILFLSVYHHILYNHGKDKADEVFHRLFKQCRFLVFDSGHPEESGLYRQGWIKEMQKHFKTEKELFDHFGLNYFVLGKWRTTQGDERTIVVFENKDFS